MLQFSSWRNGSLLQRRAFTILLFLKRLPSFLHRFSIYSHNFQLLPKFYPYLKYLRSYGYVRIPANTFFSASDLLPIIDLSNTKLHHSTHHKTYLVPLFALEDLPDIPCLSLFFNTPQLFALISSYFAHLPIFTYFNVWLSPNLKSNNTYEGSQLWHLDHESITQLKVFVYLSEVTSDNGCMNIIPAPLSEKLQRQMKYRPASSSKHFDSSILDSFSLPLAGSIGDIFIVDTSRCFHRGSACRTGIPRLIALSQFLPIFAFSSNKFGQLSHASLSKSCISEPLLFHV